NNPIFQTKNSVKDFRDNISNVTTPIPGHNNVYNAETFLNNSGSTNKVNRKEKIDISISEKNIKKIEEIINKGGKGRRTNEDIFGSNLSKVTNVNVTNTHIEHQSVKNDLESIQDSFGAGNRILTETIHNENKTEELLKKIDNILLES